MTTTRRNFIIKTGLAGMAGLSFPVAGMANSKINPMDKFKKERPKIIFFVIAGVYVIYYQMALFGF